MAKLTTGYAFTTNETVTPTKFHTMVDAAFLTDLVTEELQAGGRFIRIVTPASPNTGDVRVGSDGRLEFFYNSVWNNSPADPQVIVLTNKSGSDLVQGDVVIPDAANPDSFTIATVDRGPAVIGVLNEDIANNATGQVCIRGVCDVRIAPVLIGGQYIAQPGYFLQTPDGTTATTEEKVAAVANPNSPRSDYLGIVLQQATSGPTALVSCYIWK